MKNTPAPSIHHAKWPFYRRVVLMLALIGLGSVVSTWLYVVQRDQDQDRIGQLFDSHTDEKTLLLQGRVVRIQDMFIDLGKAVEDSPEMTRKDFHHLTEPMLAHNQDLESIQWLPRVFLDNRAEYESEARRQGINTFTIHDIDKNGNANPSEFAPEYFPVYFAEPAQEYSWLAGQNRWTNKVHRETLEQALASEKPIASPILSPTEYNGTQCFQIVVPVFINKLSINQDLSHERTLIGFVVGAVSAQSFIEQQFDEYDLDFFSLAVSDHGDTFYHSQTDIEKTKASNRIQILDREWLMDFSPKSRFNSMVGTSDASILLTVGISMATALGVFVFFLVGKNDRIAANMLTIEHSTNLLNQKAQLLEHSNKELSNARDEFERFALVAAHDLKSPLFTISGFTNILKAEFPKDSNQEDAKMALECIQSSIDRMTLLINDLLSFAQSGTTNPLVQVDLDKTIQLVWESLAANVLQTGAKVQADPLPNITGDHISLMQLFQNLVSNALKFCDKDNPVVNVFSISHSEYHEIIVKDNGIGIAQNELDSLFSVFSRSKNAGNFEGTGLGLATCKRIIDNHGGKIWIESELGKGTEIHFTLMKCGEKSTLKTSPSPLAA